MLYSNNTKEGAVVRARQIWGATALAIINFSVCFALSYFYTWRNIFKTTESTVFFILSAVLFFFVCILAWHLILKLIYSLKAKSKRARSFLFFGGIFFAVMTFFYLLTFPGVWSNDALTILQFSRHFVLYCWHHVFSQVTYIMAMFFFINPMFIVLFQIIVLSCVVGYLLSDFRLLVEEKWGINTKLFFMLLIPFLLPSTIASVLEPLRLNSYAFVELLMFYEIIAMKIRKKDVSMQKAIVYGALISLLAFWRSESVIYIVLVPLVLFLFSKKQFSKKTVCGFAASMLVMSAGMCIPQKIAITKRSIDLSIFESYQKPTVPVVGEGHIDTFETAYILSGKLSLIVNLGKISYAKGDDLVPILEKYFDMENVAKNTALGAIMWDGYVSIKKSDLKEIDQLYFKLIWRHFPSYIVQRLETFAATNAFSPFHYHFIKTGSQIREANNGYGITEVAFSDKFRTGVIKALQMPRLNLFILGPIIYSLIPALIFFFALAIKSIKKLKHSRNKKYFIPLIISLSILAKNFIIFLTAPGTFFMYYYPMYLIGYFCIFAFWAYKLDLKNKLKKEKYVIIQEKPLTGEKEDKN